MIKCHICGNINKISYVTNSIRKNISNILSCSKCNKGNKPIDSYKSLFNQIVLHYKRLIDNFHSKERKCNRCNNITRNLLINKCFEPECLGGQLKPIYEESELANDLNMVAKLFEIYPSDRSDKHDSSIDFYEGLLKNELKNIVDYTSSLKRINEYNTINLGDLLHSILFHKVP